MSRKQQLTIMPLSDVHYGNPSFNQPLFDKWLDIAKYTKHKVILLNGDLLEFLDSNRFYKPKDYLSVNEQLEYIIDSLKPFKKNIICNLNGNHGTRTVKQYDLDTDRLIGDELGVETTKSYHDDLCIRKGREPRYIRVYSQHKAPTSKSILLAMRRFIDTMENIDAELYFGSHNHKTMGVTKIYRGLDYTPIRKTFIFTGSFLDYKGSYAEDGGYGFQIPSFPIVTVDKNYNVNTRIVWADTLGDDY